MEGSYNRPSNFQYQIDRRLEVVSGKGSGGGVRSPARTSTSSKPWGGLGDPESKRRKRVAKYKVYTVEGRVKATFRKGIRWIKSKCSDFIHGF